MTPASIIAEYDVAYKRLPAFLAGLRASVADPNPYRPDSVEAQAYDRGLEAAMRIRRLSTRVEG